MFVSEIGGLRQRACRQVAEAGPSSWFLLALCAFAVAACSMLFAGCSSGEKGAVAAMVNGEAIYEQDITDYVESYRKHNGYEDDGAWVAYLEGAGYDPSSLREYLITCYARMIVMKSAAEDLGITLPNKAEVQAAMEQQKLNYEDMADYYSGKYGVNDWETYFGQMFVTEYNFYKAVESDLVEERLRKKLLDGISIEDSQYEEFFSKYGGYYDATYISRIAFADESAALEALNSLKAGDMTWEEAVVTYEADDALRTSGGEIGWSIFNASSFTAESFSVISSMKAGEFAGPCVNGDGKFEIYYCSKTYDAPEGEEKLVLADVPEEILDHVTEKLLDNAYDARLAEILSDSKAELSAMPEGLSYDVDMTPAGDAPSDGAA